ncbi:MAG: hypothetical protein DRO40_08940 [Thermoprotei archaeon]|nr:MAG: hypothetical protein DRO40_08940 [Thermoprotei archaeon]
MRPDLDVKKYWPLKWLIVLVYYIIHILLGLAYTIPFAVYLAPGLTLLGMALLNKGRKHMINIKTDISRISLVFPIAILDLLEYLITNSIQHIGLGIIGLGIIVWLYL